MPIEVEVHEPAGGGRRDNTKCPSIRYVTLFKVADGERASVMTIKAQCSLITAHPGRPHRSVWGEATVEWDGPDWIEKWYVTDD